MKIVSVFTTGRRVDFPLEKGGPGSGRYPAGSGKEGSDREVPKQPENRYAGSDPEMADALRDLTDEDIAIAAIELETEGVNPFERGTHGISNIVHHLIMANRIVPTGDSNKISNHVEERYPEAVSNYSPG